ncbi:2-hydroxychromene-2-carboxylate isomerase [soil metagenome]
MPNRIDATPIDFWFDFASPYGYFMSEKIDALASRHGRSVRWRPVLLFAVLRVLELPAPLGNDIKRDYMRRDFERSARFLGVPYRLPEGFPAVTQHAARAVYLIDGLEGDGSAMAARFARSVMRDYFIDGAPIGDIEWIAARVMREAPALGDVQQVVASLQTATARAALAAAVDTAIAQRIFGSPFVVIDGEPFFGVDRLPQIEAMLAGELKPA